MKKMIAFMMMTLLTAGMCLAGTVKVLKTEYAGVDIDEDGPYVTINVQLQVSNVKQEECSCIALLNNSKWNGENMTIAKLANLSQTMCEGDTDLDPVTGTKTITVPVYVPLDATLLTGTEKTFFLKSYVVDMNKKAIIAQGTMINFVPNPKESMAKKQQDINSQVMKMATKNLGHKKGGQTKGDTKKVTVSCPECSGSGKTYRYDLNRYVSCDRCDGDGKITKDQKAAGDQNVFDILSPVLGGY